MKRSKTSSDVLSLDAHAQRVSERSPPKVPRTITHFFAPSGPLNPTTSASDASAPLPGTPTGCRSQQLAEKDRDLAGREADLEAKERALVEREKEIARREASQAKFEEEALQRAAAVSREERAQAEGLRRQHDQRVTDTMKGLLVARAREERALISARLCSDTARVGRVGYIRSGLSVSEVWEDGTAWSDLIRRGEELEAEESRLERDKKAFAKRCKSSNSAGSSAANAGGVGMPPPPVPSDEQAEQEEIYRLRMQKVRDKKKMLQEEKEKLEREKYSLIREIKRVQDQNRSKYNSFPLLNKRYLLLHLLGKGGFSEVYKAFDLLEMQEVACKIHELNCQWSEEKKTNYMKHATREYEIQKKLCHQRIVRLLDVFEVSSDGFCTVLEYCDGGDLEQVLKAQRILPEREARSIIMQVFAGLRYLNDQKHRVIHYDLKPANILFHNGEVKISDFGLSKIMDESEGGSMELTSQGAGTYWYLPPECFEVGHAPPKISSKVDVWSAGVIFYQMLFGVKPFGHGMSQEKMLIEQVAALLPIGLSQLTWAYTLSFIVRFPSLRSEAYL
jgi:tousled-like kinase